MRETVAWGREVFGANGIIVDYNAARFFADAEALYSYEGTYQMQNLIVGKAVTGLSALRVMRTGEREAHAPLICNRTRQAMIAKELIEIIPGREAI